MPHSKLPPCHPRQFAITHDNNTILSTAHGLGADNVPAHEEGAGAAGGDAPVAGDSYASVGVGSHATNVPGGEHGNVGQKVNERPAQ
ncbi:uncharacterized protein LTHEOB_457 [Lasiodiplodia theobromae]|uniref:uncharacterized protein n=1 Tax=Lasiodiplodia theobromae TaxID=45133 RepID=UPI0015C2F96A|nr:uncharacterized protein LTHEOB_457 [Lasiodiplodia theobromae]KAF4543758.1 hypothetical protein LTHEOB_457 [Lasiodiplodia theobromae]